MRDSGSGRMIRFPFDAELLQSEATPRAIDPSPVGLVEQVEAVAPREGRRSRFRGTLLAVCAAIVAFAGFSALLTRDRKLPAKQTAPVAIQRAGAPASLPLQLDVDAQGRGLNIRWNPQSVPVAQAREGHLVIMEPGEQPEVMTLDPAQLTSGHVYYQSAAKRLEFRLEVVDGNGTTTKESVLALSSKPASPIGPQPAGHGPSRIRQAPSNPVAGAAAEPTRTATILQALHERKVSFIVRKNHSRELAPGISLGVTGTDVTSARMDGWMWLMPDRRTIWLRNQGAQEPVVFYGDRDGKKRELLITKVTASSVTGYLLLPGE